MARITTGAAVLAGLVVLVGSAQLLAGSRDGAAAEFASPGDGSTIMKSVPVTRIETVPTTVTLVPETVTVAPETVTLIPETVTLIPETVTVATATVTLAQETGVQVAARVTVAEAAARAASATAGPGRLPAPVAAPRLDSGVSADSMTSTSGAPNETWVAGSGKGLSYTGMTTGVAFGVGFVLLIGGLVVSTISRRCPTRGTVHPAQRFRER